MSKKPVKKQTPAKKPKKFKLEPIHKERLETLARTLMVVPPNRFDLNSWVGGGSNATEIGCGMTGCAGGWACTIPEFRFQGLRMVDGGPEYKDPKTGKNYDRPFVAMSKFFGTDFKYRPDSYHAIRHDCGTWHLFSPSQYTVKQQTDPKYVARRIRKYVSEH